MKSKAGKSSLLIFGSIIVIMIIVFIGSLTFLKNIYQTETYYVLNQDVSTRTQLTPDLLDPIVTSEGTAPPNTLTIEDVQEGNLFAQFPLSAGDVLLFSNVTGYKDISTGIPDDFVVTSINVSADNASGGRIHRGVYFDMMVYDDNNEEVFYPFVNILALDTTVSMSSASSQDAIDTEEAQGGQVSYYYIGVTPEDAAYIEIISQRYSGNIKLILSPRQNEYNKPKISDFTGIFRYETGEFIKLEGNVPKNLGEFTDYTFTQLERDEFGRPIKELVNCGNGNAIILPDPETQKCPEGLILEKDSEFKPTHDSDEFENQIQEDEEAIFEEEDITEDDMTVEEIE